MSVLMILTVIFSVNDVSHLCLRVDWSILDALCLFCKKKLDKSYPCLVFMLCVQQKTQATSTSFDVKSLSLHLLDIILLSMLCSSSWMLCSLSLLRSQSPMKLWPSWPEEMEKQGVHKTERESENILLKIPQSLFWVWPTVR